MARRMAQAGYRAQQWRDRYAPHVAPINELVDELGTRDGAGRAPYVAPMYRGVHARALAVLRDPGPMAGGRKGSGFLSVENDDQSAERQGDFFREAGIDPADVVPWNAYPWYINDKPTTAQLTAGIEPLRRMIALMPDLRVVLLEGREAEAAWALFRQAHGAWVRSRGIATVATYHPSRQALWHPDPRERDRREDHIRTELRRVATLIGADDRDTGAGAPAAGDRAAGDRAAGDRAAGDRAAGDRAAGDRAAGDRAAGATPPEPGRIDVVDVDVVGRPTTYGGGDLEIAWKKAVATAAGRRDVPDSARFAVEVEFRLPPPRTRNDRWDLDNLLKSTLDALGGVIGWRRWAGRPQADDERVDRIVASKRAATDDEEPGARLRIVPLER